MPITINGTGTITGVSSLATALVNPIVTTTMGVGNATPSASGSGITFPAIQSASSNANTLDDYEEGTWTGTLAGGTTNPTTPVSTTGAYTKIGDLVMVSIAFNNVTTTGASGQVQITGLPFTNSSTYYANGSIWINHASTSGMITTDVGSTVLIMLSFIGSSVNWSGVGAGAYIRLSITYKSA
jgi:hypothetical protein